MTWIVDFHPEFLKEAQRLPKNVKQTLTTYVKLLQQFGYELKRPFADTLKNSKHKNMKELHFIADNGIWRIAMRSIPKGMPLFLLQAISRILNEERFYRTLIAKADHRFDAHLAELDKEKKL